MNELAPSFVASFSMAFLGACVICIIAGGFVRLGPEDFKELADIPGPEKMTLLEIARTNARGSKKLALILPEIAFMVVVSAGLALAHTLSKHFGPEFNDWEELGLTVFAFFIGYQTSWPIKKRYLRPYVQRALSERGPRSSPNTHSLN